MSSFSRLRHLAFAGAFLFAANLDAQRVEDLRARARVIDVESKLTLLVGSLERASGDSVIIRVEDGRVMPFRMHESVRLEVSRGHHSLFGRGLRRGVVTGLWLAGATTAIIVVTGDLDHPAGAMTALVSWIALPLYGGAVGGVIGALLRAERWEPAPMPSGAPSR